jgi:hypothetical protein
LSFEEFPKIARLSRNCVITEKIDGTNAQVHIATRAEIEDGLQSLARVVEIDGQAAYVLAGSRNRYVTPSADNFEFTAWVYEHAEELSNLGYGRHFGEWWGSGIQRGYGLQKGEKRFSLFNTSRGADERDREKYPKDRPSVCGAVPVIYAGPFDTFLVDGILATLREKGSVASPGFMRPEGVVIYHEAARLYFKKTLEKDEEPKSKAVA